jgi:hypothetical protein
MPGHVSSGTATESAPTHASDSTAFGSHLAEFLAECILEVYHANQTISLEQAHGVIAITAIAWSID